MCNFSLDIRFEFNKLKYLKGGIFAQSTEVWTITYILDQRVKTKYYSEHF